MADITLPEKLESSPRREDAEEFERLQCLTSVNHEAREFHSPLRLPTPKDAIAQRDDDGSGRFGKPPAAAAVEPSEGYLDQDVAKFFYRWGGLLSSTLIRIRGRFHGDLDEYLIYLVFLLTELAQVVAAKEAAARGARPRTPSRRGLNALSIADITRIPRETARRKLHALSASGYLVRDGEGLFYLGDVYGLDEFFHDLKPLFWDGVRLPAN
jgi:hypothetical protein